MQDDWAHHGFRTNNSFRGVSNGPVVQAGAIHGGVHLQGPESPFVLHAHVEQPTVEFSALSTAQPSQLLLARNQVVDFDFASREGDLRRLHGWLDSPHRLSLWTLYAPGGCGKTRLATEFAAQAAQRHWHVVFARHKRDRFPQDSVRRPASSGRALLVVVDYADRWPRDHLEDLFEHLRMQGAPFVRILLLARSNQRWWTPLLNPLRKLGIHAEKHRLQDLATDPKARQRVFRAAHDRFSAALGVRVAAATPAGLHTNKAYASVLMIHMAALVAVDAAANHRSAPADPGSLSRYLLDREIDHWTTMHANHRVSTKVEVLGRAAFIATLAGPLPHDEGIRALCELRVVSSEAEAADVLADHRACYPPADNRTVLEPMYPDRLGEDFLSYMLPNRDDPVAEGELVDLWTSTIAARLADLDVRSAQVITVLAEAGRRWHHVRLHLHDLVKADPRRAVRAGGAALMAIATTADEAVLTAVEPHLPDRHLALDPASARIMQRLTAPRLQSAGSDEERARLHLVLSARLDNAGAFEEARQSTERAVEIYRRSAAHNHGDAVGGLGTALHQLAKHLTALGQHKPALAAAEEAVTIRRRLAITGDEAADHDLASSMTNLAAALANVDIHHGALTTIEEAVSLHRTLASRRPMQHNATLAYSLDNLGTHLAMADRVLEAVAASEEAVRLLRELVEREPHVYTADLAAALHNLGMHHSASGARSKGLEASQEATQIRSLLVASNPRVAFFVDLAVSLRNLAVDCSGLGLPQEALKYTDQAIEIYEQLRQSAPDEHEDDLAMCRHNKAMILAQLGRAVDAVDVAALASSGRIMVTSRKLDEYQRLLELELAGLGIPVPLTSQSGSQPVTVPPRLRGLQRHVWSIYRAHEPGPEQSNRNLETRLTRAARLTHALRDFRTDAVTPLVLAERELTRRQVELARSLIMYSVRLGVVGRLTEALSNAQFAAELCRRATSASRSPYQLDFAASLANLGLRLIDIGLRDDALAATEYATAILWKPAALGSATSERLGKVLHAYAAVRWTTGRELHRALAATDHAQTIYHELSLSEPSVFEATAEALARTRAALHQRLSDRGERASLPTTWHPTDADSRRLSN